MQKPPTRPISGCSSHQFSGKRVRPLPRFQTAEGTRPRRDLLCPLYIADERIRIEVCIRTVGILVQFAHESHDFIHILWILWVSAAEPDLRRRRNALGIRPSNGRKRGVFLWQMRGIILVNHVDIAVFVKFEQTIDFDKTFACSFVFAPTTFTSKSAVAPSPSPAISFASVFIDIMESFLKLFVFFCSIFNLLIICHSVSQQKEPYRL